MQGGISEFWATHRREPISRGALDAPALNTMAMLPAHTVIGLVGICYLAPGPQSLRLTKGERLSVGDALDPPANSLTHTLPNDDDLSGPCRFNHMADVLIPTDLK